MSTSQQRLLDYSMIIRLSLFMILIGTCYTRSDRAIGSDAASEASRPVVSGSAITHGKTHRKPRPNILMIIADDQGWSDYGFMGHPQIRTPSLDRLAQRSAVFRRGYVPTALCRPSLMTMITGRYPHQHGITGNDPFRSPGMQDSEFADQRGKLISRAAQSPMLPEILRPLGYNSHQSGKWWEGNYRTGGFTHGMTRGFPEPGGRHGDDGLTIGRKGLAPVLTFIDESVAAQKPFFVWYAPFLPHTPHDPPERLLNHYQSIGLSPPLARYYAMCEWFDETCGQLLNHLDQRELTQDTLICYACDNGWIQPDPEHSPLPEGWKQPFAPRSKQSPYDGGIRTPILFSWPDVIIPGDRTELCTTLDLVPTLIAAALQYSSDKPPAEVSAETRVQTETRTPDASPAANVLPGKNLMPLLTNTGGLDRSSLFGESFSHDIIDADHPESSLMYRWCIDGPWKLILTYECRSDRYADAHLSYDHRPQLYHLHDDPLEQRNLATAERERVRALAEKIQMQWPVSKMPDGLAELVP